MVMLSPKRRVIRWCSAVLILCMMLQGCQSESSSAPFIPLSSFASPAPEGFGKTPARFSPADAPVVLSENPAKPQDLIHPFEFNKTRIELHNADGRVSLAAQADRASSQGWSTAGECGNGDVGLDAGGGKRHFLTLNTGCELTQSSQSIVKSSSAISLQFSLSADNRFASNSHNRSVSLFVEILGFDRSGVVQVLQAKNIYLDSGTTDWQRKQVLLDSDGLAISDDVAVGVRFTAVGDMDFTWYLTDVVVDVFAQRENNDTQFADSWDGVCNQIWVGSNYWANRSRDWHVDDGKLKSRNGSRYRPMRTLHRITSHVSAAPENFELSVLTGLSSAPSHDSFPGLLLGAGNGLDYRAAALIHNRSGRNGGLIAGIRSSGQVFLHDNGIANRELGVGRQSQLTGQGVTLKLVGDYLGDSTYRLSVSAISRAGDVLSTASAEVPAHRVLGNIGLVSNPGANDTEHWFDRFEGSGAKLHEVSARVFGPVLMSTYMLSRNALSLNAQFPQICIDEYASAQLSVKQDDQWVVVASADIDPAAFVSRFTVANWDASRDVVYRVELGAHHYYGVIQAEPTDTEDFIISTYNCRPGVILNDKEGWIQQNNPDPFTWTAERIAYPHAELMSNAAEHGSHMLAFLGDQIYEFDPNGYIDSSSTESLIEDYFWKWQQFVFAVREYTRSTPSFIIPDDHDVYQGNIWGAGGIPANEEVAGGYVYPSEFIQIVQKTQTGSLPRSTDAAPVAQGIDVYFTDIVYGGIGIAVLEDRKFKSNPSTSNAEAVLLGDRQLSFLEAWAKDWENQKLKLVVSQSPFAQSTTHSGANTTPNNLDKDSNGWPKSGRDKAVVAIRKALAPHVNGDQHLGMSIKHGVSQHNDAVHSFSGPSMLNIFPRIWDPHNQQSGPGDKSVEYAGDYKDAHGNLITVLAAANPDAYYLPPTKQSRQKDQLGIGYGIVRMNKLQRTYEFAAWPANVEPLTAAASPYEGWPIMVAQSDNDGRKPVGYLQQRIAPVEEAVVSVFDEQTQELVYARRYSSSIIDLPVFDVSSSYTVEIADTATGYREVFTDQQIQ